MTTTEAIMCACGAGPFKMKVGLNGHMRGKAHAAKMAELFTDPPPVETPDGSTAGQMAILTTAVSPVAGSSPYDAPDFQAIIRLAGEPYPKNKDLYTERCQQTAKLTRKAFNMRGWPNEDHPLDVRDFLIDFNVPVIDTTLSTEALGE